MKRIVMVLLALSLLVGCSPEAKEATEQPEATTVVTANIADSFSNRDYETAYDEDHAAYITLNGTQAQCDSDAVRIENGTITIIDEGTYVLSGTLTDGMVIVNAEKKDKTQLVLNNVEITSASSAAIYVLQADKVFVTVADGSENILCNGGTFTAIDENNIDAVIFSKEDLTINGTGALTVESPAGHGIVSKDELHITSGEIEINCAGHGIDGKDNVCIAEASLNITSGKDGIHAENDEDASLGYLYIQSGTFDITAQGDGISASAQAQIDDGMFNLLSGGGSVNAEKQTSDMWGGMGGHGGGPGFMGESSSKETEDSTSIKGVKASGNLTVNGGTFNIDSADDAIHSNASITVNGGEFQISSGDDAFHADETLTILGGEIAITESYEGLEGLHILISGGVIELSASDDGLNAAGGTDQSGMGGTRGGDRFGGGMGGSSNGSIVIEGGQLHIYAEGDGIDANGTLSITGGYTTVCGPTNGDTATLDYDISATISGGTFIGTGAYGMAQTFSDSEQGVFAVSVGNQAAGTPITLTDLNGNTIITSYAPESNFAVVILSSPDIIKGVTYRIMIGEQSGEFAAS